MLRLKRLPKDRITISIQDKSRTFDLRFWRSFGYSFLFHVILIGTIRVEYLRIHESDAPLVPVEVAIDKEPVETVIADAANDTSRKVLGLNSYTMTYPVVAYAKRPADADLTQALQNRYRDQMQIARAAADYAASEPVPAEDDFKERIYPLRVELSPQLDQLKLVCDGSSLFREKRTSDMVSRLRLTTHHISIDYQVRVHGASGELISWKRSHELLDKTLQNVADRVIQQVRFGTSSDQDIKGVIRLYFECSGDEIGQYLLEPGHD